MTTTDVQHALKSNYQLLWVGMATSMALRTLEKSKDELPPNDFSDYFARFIRAASSADGINVNKEGKALIKSFIDEIRSHSESIEAKITRKCGVLEVAKDKAAFVNFTQQLVLRCCDSIKVILDEHDINANPIHHTKIQVTQGSNVWLYDIQANCISEFNRSSIDLYLNGDKATELNLNAEGLYVSKAIGLAVVSEAQSMAMEYIEQKLRESE